MFTLDKPLVIAPLAGGYGSKPPIKDSRPFARPDSGKDNTARLNQSPVIAKPVTYSKTALTEKRIIKCEQHHARFLKWRKANTARLRAWVLSQPDYNESWELRSKYESRIRNAFRANNRSRQSLQAFSDLI
jgi:hypothetical protein